jgi:hypothetical protein
MPRRWWTYPLLAFATLIIAALLLVGYAAAGPADSLQT